jgi:RNA polymerase sigma-70 factor (ECF subfamily)
MAKKQKSDSLKDLGIKFKETRSERAFNELYHRIRPGLFHYVNNMLNNSEDTDHVVSAVMASVYDKIDQYDVKWHISTWIYRIAYTHACGKLRQRKASKTTPMSYFEYGENKNYIDKMEFESIENHTDHLIIKEEDAEYNEEIKRVRSIIENLPEEYREVIFEKFFNDLSYEEIHQKLNIPLHTVKNRVARGKKLFKEIFEA